MLGSTAPRTAEHTRAEPSAPVRGGAARAGALLAWRTWLFHIGLLGALYLLRDAYLHHAKPPEEVYVGSVLLLGALRDPAFLATLIVPSLLPALRWKELRWSRIPDGRALRILVAAIALALAWAFSTYDYNAYFDRMHAADRAALALLAAGVVLHAALAPAFLAVLIAIASQFEHPFGGFSWTDKIVPVEILIAFVLWLHLRALRKEASATFVFLALLITAGHYVFPAFSKLASLWILRDDLASLTASCHAHGWLAAIDDETFLGLLRTVRRVDPLLRIGTQAIEASAVLLLFHRRAWIWVLPACVLLHLGIFAASAILFWKWIVTDVALWLALARLDGATLAAVHRPSLRAFALFALLTVKVWLDPSSLTWYDTPLTYCYELEATGQSGRTYRVPRAYLAPYDIAFAQNRFWYLSEDRVPVETFGTTPSYDLARSLAHATPEDVARIEAAGRSRFDAAKAERFDRFVRAFFAHASRRDPDRPTLGWIAAPHHIWLGAAGDDLYAGQEPVVRIDVVRETRYWDGNAFERLASRRVRSIAVEP